MTDPKIEAPCPVCGLTDEQKNQIESFAARHGVSPTQALALAIETLTEVEAGEDLS